MTPPVRPEPQDEFDALFSAPPPKGGRRTAPSTLLAGDEFDTIFRQAPPTAAPRTMAPAQVDAIRQGAMARQPVVTSGPLRNVAAVPDLPTVPAPADTPRYATPVLSAAPDAPPAAPSRWRQAAGFLGDMVTAPVRSGLTLLDAPVQGEEISAARANRGKGGVIDPTGRLLRVGAPGGPAPVVSDLNTSGAITPRELHQAGFESAMNAALSAIPAGAFGRGAAASPGAGGLLARAGRAAVRGAVHGAVVNGAAGGIEGLALGDEQGQHRLSAAGYGALGGAATGAAAGGLFAGTGTALGEGYARLMAARRAVPTPPGALAGQADALMGRVPFAPEPRTPAEQFVRSSQQRIDALHRTAGGRGAAPLPGVLRPPAAFAGGPVVPLEDHFAMLDARDAAERAAARPASIAVQGPAAPAPAAPARPFVAQRITAAAQKAPAEAAPAVPQSHVGWDPTVPIEVDPNAEGWTPEEPKRSALEQAVYDKKKNAEEAKFNRQQAKLHAEGKPTSPNWTPPAAEPPAGWTPAPADAPPAPEQVAGPPAAPEPALAKAAKGKKAAKPKKESLSARGKDRADGTVGALKNLENVHRYALMDEWHRQQQIIEKHQASTLYHFTPDENMHSTEDGRSVLHAGKRNARGNTPQAEAQKIVDNARATQAKIEAEYARRGLDHTADVQLMHEDPEGWAEAAAKHGVGVQEANADNFEFDERFSGFGLTRAMKAKIRGAFRSTVVTPYAGIEREAPALVAALNRSGASESRALHMGTRRVEHTLEGLTPAQEAEGTAAIVRENMLEEANRKEAAAAAMAAANPAPVQPHLPGMPAPVTPHPGQELLDAAARWRQHAALLDPVVSPDIDQQPWFTQFVERHKANYATPIDADALAAGVSPNSLRQTKYGYIKLADASIMDDNDLTAYARAKEIKKADVKPAGPLKRMLLGENRQLRGLFPNGHPSMPQSPLTGPNAGWPGERNPVQRQRVGVTKSAGMAMGTAKVYSTDYRRIVAADVLDKGRKAARNGVYQAIADHGRLMAEHERKPADDMDVLSFDDARGLVTGGTTGTHRYEVTPAVRDAVQLYHQQSEGRIKSIAGRKWRAITGALTHAQIAGMPVEATSHANTLMSIVASVLGEKDWKGKALAAVPGLGGKVAAGREMWQLDFNDKATRALEYRLADIGALRVEDGGPVTGFFTAATKGQRPEAALNASHHWLFGPEGIDVRGRLVLARKYLDRRPEATDEELREFVTGKLGNYVRANSGPLINGLQDTGIASYARFQAARIPTSIKAAFGHSGLPSSGMGQSVSDAAQTLYRGPVGHLLGANLLNYAFTGHSTFQNERGHSLDVDTGLMATPDGTKIAGHHPERLIAKYGEGARPILAPGATMNPVAVGGLRSSGLRAVLFSPRDGGTGRFADAMKDVANTAAGTLSPAAKFASVALTGRTPYVQSDGAPMRVVQPRFNPDYEAADRLREAGLAANPAVNAMLGTAGEAGGRSMAGAVSQDGRLFGGREASAWRLAEFLLPRIAMPGVGGLRNAAAAENQRQHTFDDVMSAYKFELRQKHGPADARQVIEEAKKDGASMGYQASAIGRELERYAKVPDEKRAKIAARSAKRFEKKHEAPAAPNDGSFLGFLGLNRAARKQVAPAAPNRTTP